MKLGDPLNGYEAKAKVRMPGEAVLWLRENACSHYPDGEFARKDGGFVFVEPADSRVRRRVYRPTPRRCS